MPDEFVPLPGAEGWQLSNPSIFACAPLLASLQIFQDAGINALRSKSLQLTSYLQHLLTSLIGAHIELITPSDPHARGCQLSLRLRVPLDRARQIHQQLQTLGVICDWREPNVIRVTPVPLYNRYVDAWQFATALQSLLT